MVRPTPMAVLFALTTLVPLAASAPRPALRFDIPAGVAEFPFDLHNNHVTFRGRLNDSDSLWFTLDSGAQGVAMSASRAHELGWRAEAGGVSAGSGGSVESGIVRDATVRMPGVELGPQNLNTIPLDAIALQTGRPMDVIVGHPLFSRSVVEIDYAERRVRVHDSEGFQYRGSGAILPLTFEQDLPYVKARIEVTGRPPIEGRFLIDTGGASALLLASSFVESHRVLESVPKTIKVRVGGVGGPVENPLGRIERLHLGPYAIEGPVTTFHVAGAGRISAAGTAGNIGGEILRRFRVTFDYPRRRMILEPNRSLTEPFVADMSGLMLQVTPDSARSVRVLGTQADSPARETGFEAGDVIEAIDGRLVGEIGPTELRRMFRVVGATYRVTLRRGEERREIALTTRRLI